MREMGRELIKGIVQQSGRTALFARINRETADILTLLGELGELDGVSDELAETVERELLIHSAGEFCRRFPPSVYFCMEQGEIRFGEGPLLSGYEPVADRLMWHRLSLCEYGTDAVLSRLFNTEAADAAEWSRTSIRLFRDEEGIREIRAIKDELAGIFLFPGKQDQAVRGQKLMGLAQRVAEKRYEIRSLLPYLAEKALYPGQDNRDEKAFGGVLSRKAEIAELELRCHFRETENLSRFLSEEAGAELDRWLNEVIRVEQGEVTAPAFAESRKAEVLIEKKSHIEKEFSNEESSHIEEKFSNEEKTHIEEEIFITVESIEWKELLLSVFGAGNSREPDRSAVFYRNMYRRAAAAFYRAVRKTAELCLSVEAFFAQGRKTADTLELLVLNISPQELDIPENRRTFSVYLNTVNGKNNYRSTVWAGILPGVRMHKEEEKNVRQRFAGSGGEVTEAVEPETVINLMELAETYRIMLFYQYETKEDASARAFAKSGMRRFREAGRTYEKSAGAEYISCCYPNLTVAEGELFLGAAFIAAGMQASLQSSAYLRLFYRNVAEGLPGIRLDPEKTAASRRLTAAAPRELYPYSGAVKEELGHTGYGSLLASEGVMPGWGELSEMQLMYARTLCYSQGEYIPVFQVMAESYLIRLLRALTHDFKEDELKYQFSNAPGSVLVRLREYGEYANAPLHKGDRIEYRMEQDQSCSIIIHWDTGGR